MKLKTLQDSIELRAKRIKAYELGKYRFNVPPVSTAYWNDESWCNWVKFEDESLSGFLPYDEEAQKKALNTLKSNSLKNEAEL